MDLERTGGAIYGRGFGFGDGCSRGVRRCSGFEGEKAKPIWVAVVAARFKRQLLGKIFIRISLSDGFWHVWHVIRVCETERDGERGIVEGEEGDKGGEER